jgi:hypothetical protein
MPYDRPFGASKADFADARQFEEEVGDWLGDYRIGNLDSTTRLDWWIPGCFLDVKEKRQPLTARWQILDDVDEVDTFVLDELSIRRAAEHFPHAYFLMRCRPTGRVFLARVDEVFCADRVRRDRVSSNGHRKGKWIVDMTQFRQLANPEVELRQMLLADQVEMPWKTSSCLATKQIEEI